MTDAIAYKDAEISLVVTRCGCGNPGAHRGAVCPKPRAEHDLGVVSQTSDNPLKRLLWKFHGQPAADKRIQEANRS